MVVIGRSGFNEIGRGVDADHFGALVADLGGQRAVAATQVEDFVGGAGGEPGKDLCGEKWDKGRRGLIGLRRPSVFCLGRWWFFI